MKTEQLGQLTAAKPLLQPTAQQCCHTATSLHYARTNQHIRHTCSSGADACWLNVCYVQVCLEEGSLICPETGRRFPVTKGIPNMLLNEDEV
jgi:uncharacterized protein YbaR (Trm112 family)